MKPAPVEFERATSIDEALELLATHEDAKVLAGGQSLLPLMNLRFAVPTVLVDVNEIPDLAAVRADQDGLVIQALTRHVALQNAGLAGAWGAFADAMPMVGHHPIRVRGTFGGSVVHADPTAELPLIAVTLGAELVLRSMAGERRAQAQHFFVGPLLTDVQPDELLVEARFENPPAGTVSVFEEFHERAGDFALASACVALTRDENGTCTWARVGLGAVAAVPFRATQVEDMLVGSRLTDSLIADAAAAAAASGNPSDTVAASTEFRRELVAELVTRALRRIWN
jgi:CO/xanthine dehydrogenase FAD-binding subunit